MTFDSILRYCQSINALSRSLIERPAFEEVHVWLPDPASPESAFVRGTSWMYCLYFEAGRVSVRFLSGVGETMGIIDASAARQHMEEVRCLRTELHHNLGFVDSDSETRNAAELWRRKACGTVLPNREHQWTDCYTSLVNDGVDFLRKLEDVVRQLEAEGDDAAGQLEDWLRRLDRSWPAAAFDPLIDDAKSRLGRNALNIVAFRNRHLDRWRQHFDMLEDGFDFEREATLLIEKTLLDDGAAVLPISGRDIVDAFQLQPGPAVGRLLEEARRHCAANPCNAREVLEHLRTRLADLR